LKFTVWDVVLIMDWS